MLEKEMKEKIDEMKKEIERTEKRLHNHHLLITMLYKDFAEYIKEQLGGGFYDEDITDASKDALDTFFSTKKTLDVKNYRIYKNSFELIYLEQAEQIRQDVFVGKILRR